MFYSHFHNKNQRADHICNLYPDIIHIETLQEDNNSIQQNNAENEFLVEEKIFEIFHVDKGFNLQK